MSMPSSKLISSTAIQTLNLISYSKLPIMTVYTPLVQDFKEYVFRDPKRKEQFDLAIKYAIDPNRGGSDEMKAEKIGTLEDYFRYCNDLLHWVPRVSTTGDELLRKLLVFYWVFNQENLANYQTSINPASIADDPKWLSYWLVIYAREIGRFLDTKESTAGIETFYKNSKYNQEAAKWQDVPEGGWASFNQFFARHWKNIDDARPLKEEDKPDNVIVSGADSRFGGHWNVEDGYVTLKQFEWPVAKLLHDAVGAFRNGSFMHAFLGPNDYHRQHAPVSGEVIEARVIQEQVYLQVTKNSESNVVGLAPGRGLLVSKPAASPSKGEKSLDAPDEPGYQWCQTRGLIVIQTEKYGKVAVLPIGMAQVSSVVLSVQKGQKINKGDEISYFQFGGSDIVLVFEKEVDYAVESNHKCNIRTRIATFK